MLFPPEAVATNAVTAPGAVVSGGGVVGGELVGAGLVGELLGVGPAVGIGFESVLDLVLIRIVAAFEYLPFESRLKSAKA